MILNYHGNIKSDEGFAWIQLDPMYYLTIGEAGLAWISILLSVIQILALAMVFISPLGFFAMLVAALAVWIITSLISYWVMKEVKSRTRKEDICACPPCLG